MVTFFYYKKPLGKVARPIILVISWMNPFPVPPFFHALLTSQIWNSSCWPTRENLFPTLLVHQFRILVGYACFYGNRTLRRYLAFSSPLVWTIFHFLFKFFITLLLKSLILYFLDLSMFSAYNSSINPLFPLFSFHSFVSRPTFNYLRNVFLFSSGFWLEPQIYNRSHN